MGGSVHGLLSMETYAVYNATDYDYLADSDLPEYESSMFGGWPDSDSDGDSDGDSDSDGDGDSDSDGDGDSYYDPYANYDPLDTGFMPDPTVVTPGMG